MGDFADTTADGSPFDGWSSFALAVALGEAEMVREGLANGEPLNQRTPDGLTPLFIAAREGHAEIARMLLDAGASPNVQMRDGGTAMSAAMYNGHDEITRMLALTKPVKGASSAGCLLALIAALFVVVWAFL
jgi:ankyrin repeat protein